MNNTLTMSGHKLADILRTLIQGKGLTVSELARLIKIPQSTIQRIASGNHSRPHQKTLESIASYFGITTNQLRGFEPITSILNNTNIRKIPLLSGTQVFNLQNISNQNIYQVAIDIDISEKSFAMKMPDASMEPLIPKGSILIIDPMKTAQYRSFVLVKLENFEEILIRQLIKDANICYIKPVSQDFDQSKMVALKSSDIVMGVVVEVRLYYEDL